jgi:predicted dehydrogenase
MVGRCITEEFATHPLARAIMLPDSSLSRRTFLGASFASLAATRTAPATSANNKIVVGVMGTGGRGTAVAKLFATAPNVEVAYVCDVDPARAGTAQEAVANAMGSTSKPKIVSDFRRILDDKSVDVFACAACNHWHAPSSILACQAGKHVYVEKPCSHNPREGELLVAAARKNDRRVQMGNQRRSMANIREAIQSLHDGVIGRVYFAQGWYANNRQTIGKGEEGNPPEGLDYELWQGPAPRKPFMSNYLHYNWHWFWHWGNGELGNNGVHLIDVCRWGLGVDYPTSVTSTGGRYRYPDDQQTPDTNIVSFNFPGGKTITWEGFSCNQIPREKPIECLFQGENGSLATTTGGYTIYDPKGKELKTVKGSREDVPHVANLLAAIRSGEKLNSEIEEGHKSTLLCHVGNISYRTGRTLHCDSTNGRIQNDAEAMKHWSREYAPGWEAKLA